MNKFFKGLISAVLCCSFLVGCGGGDNTTPGNNDDNNGQTPGGNTTTTKTYDTETRQLKLATGALDGNFNPFYYSSANDGSILSLTQLGMMTLDEDGNLAYGEDQASVVLDYSMTLYDAKAGGNVISSGSVDGRTEYEFVIKNGIKFSDGVDLTIKDVLFSLYVYLDTAYTGSATIYSTDIQGLTAYRAQNPQLADGATDTNEAMFASDAQARIDAIIDWATDSPTNEVVPTDAQVATDLAKVKELFMEEVYSDWTSIETSWESNYKTTHRFTSAWEAYLYNEGLVTEQTYLNSNGATLNRYEDTNGNGKRDDGELYYTTLDEDTNGEVLAQQYKDDIAAATSEANISAYLTANPNSTREYAILQLQKAYCVDLVYTTYTEKSQIANVLTYWATASTALEDFTGDERTQYYEGVKNGDELAVPTISGITTYKASSFNGKDLGEEHDVLKVVINGIDPKAIYNMAFTVAPLHYYSGTYKGVDYVAQADGVTHFGVDTGNKDFFDTVVQATDKNGLPVGAGPYKASTSSGSETSSRAEFNSNNVVYFVRNSYFTTVGTGIDNAKIKYVNYQVLSDDKIVEALKTQTIDFGMPNATPTTTNDLASSTYSSFLSQVTYRTGGYGYVGVNPKSVPEIYVRQAIMKSINTNDSLIFYGSSLAEAITRPVSVTSWSYPKGATEYEAIKFTTDTSEILALCRQAGYEVQNGVLTKVRTVDGIANANLGTTLKLTFTIAGETTDHPAYNMFLNAAERLNSIGFDITVQTDIQALKKLNTGNLAVWAAAWSSSTDPDPYQIYHKDSNATSVKNWYYDGILKDSTGKWEYEQEIIERLSDLIDQGRQTLIQETRKKIYANVYDTIMELAVELPTYQRNDLCVYNKTVISAKSLVQSPSYNMGLFDKLWEIDYV
jgi:peptide/nickel transport system substrate-binding protein